MGLLVSSSSAAERPVAAYAVGVARIDITPRYPVRLAGFGFRRAESEGVTQELAARALAIDDGRPAVLIAVDACVLPGDVTRAVAERLRRTAGLPPERLTITVTHSHTAPMLRGSIPTLFGQPIPMAHQAHIDRYTAELIDKLERVARDALADRKPARLSWGVGQLDLAVNRRTRGGPVDHDLPILVIRGLDGQVRAVYVSYACHCVTLSDNKVSGDWAGFARERIEADFPGAVALVSIGCGGDSNPRSGVTGDRVDVAREQGAEIAAEVKRVAATWLAPVTGKLTTTVRRVELPLADPPTRAEWEERAKKGDARGYHARVQLQRLDRGEPLQSAIDYPVQTWRFGDSLALVFLAGEVVVDYSLRLKRELDPRRVWVNAYSNDVPCYIPSERVLREGGYEGRDAMVYYDRPSAFRPGLEGKIVDAVHKLLDERFRSPFDAGKTGGTRPLSPQQSLAAIRTKPDLGVELMVAEPLVLDPVAIDWGPDGRLWVAEMIDYPSGLDGQYKPGGRIRVLEDTDGDGKYDKATVFLDGLPFPTGLRVWRKGVLICAAPDLIYAEDTDGDGKADVVRKVLTGFGTDNYQARLNSLEYGLDGWVYASCGLFGGTIRSSPLAPGSLPAGREARTVRLGDRDFRVRPDEGLLEPATGRTQQGRVRDDWGNWFGCDNSNLCWHYPLPDHYLRRNAHVAPPPTAVLVPAGPEPNRLYPLRPELQLFKLSGPSGRATAACGLGIYRDDLLGRAYTGNAFTCEPVNLVVHRRILEPRGSTFVGRRADDEKESEFLGSTDNWSRFVQVRTGPDGCLWVVDMYRYVIEHPRWIPPEDLARLDVRAGSTMGRIYRVRPKGRTPRPVPRLDRLDTAELVAALDSPNGWQRDLAGQILLWRADPAAAGPLEALARTSPRAEARLHALCVLNELAKLRPDLVKQGLADPHPGVRRQAVRLAESFLNRAPELGSLLLRLVDDPDAQVRLQLAFSLGRWLGTRPPGRALADMAVRNASDLYLVAAVLSSVDRSNLGDVLAGVFASGRPPPEDLAQRLLSVAAALDDGTALRSVLRELIPPRNGRVAPWQLAGLAGILESLDRRGQSLDRLADGSTRAGIELMLAQARALAADDRVPEPERRSAIGVLGREPAHRTGDVALLGKLLVPQNSPALQAAALATLGRIADDRVAGVLTAGWAGYSPAVRSQVLDLLLGRDAWQRRLLDGIEKKDVPAAQVDAARRHRLLTHPDVAVRNRAARLFGGATSSDRQKVLRDYRAVVTQAGDRVRGKDVFAKRCATCHRLEGVGHAVGPDLAALSNKSPEYLLTEILDPSRNVDSRYVEYLAVTQAGRMVTGVLSGETATSVTLRGPDAKEDVLLRSELDELRSTGKSLMPEGLEKDLSHQDLADVIAYLSANAPPKAFPGNTPAVIRPAGGRLDLLATNGAIYGGEICFEQPFRNVGFWHGADDHVVWTIELPRAGRFDVWLDWACADDSAGNAYILEGGGLTLRGKVPNTGGWDRYRQQKIGSVTLDAGSHRVILRPGGPPRGALLDLRGVHLVPEGQKPSIPGASRR
jgi:putative membrane-bound dehydrogenase-like protein